MICTRVIGHTRQSASNYLYFSSISQPTTTPPIPLRHLKPTQADNMYDLSSIALPLVLLLVPLLALPRLAGWVRSNKSTLLRRLTRRPSDTSEIVSLRVYPIKSCRGFEIPKTTLHMTGLDLDRRWMLVDATTNVFITIRQIPQMTLITTSLSADGEMLVIEFKESKAMGVRGGGEIRIPLRPTPSWLEQNTTLSQVNIWNTLTDGHIYGPDVNGPFSRFLGKDVCLVYKGPTPRVCRGNGDPRILGRTPSVNFPDVLPVQIASLTSIAELNSRLTAQGEQPISIEQFRPNIIVKGNKPWTEDSWKVVRISSLKAGEQQTVAGSRPLDLDVVARCARCQVPNVNPDTAVKHPKQPWDTLVGYRRVDEGIKHKPCFGMLCVPRAEGEVEVGMKFEVLEETNKHRYMKGF